MPLRLDFVPATATLRKLPPAFRFFRSDGVLFIFTITISGRPSPSRSPVARPRAGRGVLKAGPAEEVRSLKRPFPIFRNKIVGSRYLSPTGLFSTSGYT